MPGATLPTYPARSEHEYRITLGAAEYRVRFRWLWRCASWYADVWTADGTAVVLGRRLAPGSLLVPDLSIVGVRGDLLMVFGSDGYARDDLGQTVRVLYFGIDEITASTSAEDAPLVELA